MLREPLLIPFFAFAAGVTATRLSAFQLHELVAALTLFLAFALVARFRRAPRLAFVCLNLAIVSAGALTATLHRPSNPPELDSRDGDLLILSGCVVQPPLLMPGREQFTLELEPGARANVSLIVKDGEQPPDLEYGQRVEFDAKVRKPRNFGNPGAFDYVHYLARRNVYWTASARASDGIRVLPGRCGNSVMALIFRIRSAALRRIETLYAGDDYAIAMMEAVLIGESGKLQKVWTDHFRRTGTYHALVISGLHVAVLAGAVLALLRLFLLNEIAALAIAAAGAWLYAAVSGWSAPVVRAAAGFTLYLVGRYMFRRGRVLNLVPAIALVFLIADPAQLFEASFQLSFLSVAAIGAFAIPLSERLMPRFRDASRDLPTVARDARMTPRGAELRIELRLLADTLALWTPVRAPHLLRAMEPGMRLFTWTAEMMILSGVMQIALALPMALYFHRVSITGLTANLAVVPLMSALVPVGFAAIFTGLRPVAWVAHLLLMLSARVVRWHVQFEPAHRVPDPPVWLAVVLVAALILVAVTARYRSKWLIATLGAALSAFVLLIAAPFQPEIQPAALELTAIDVGQGDALMVTTPAGKVLLVDSGGFPVFGNRPKPNLDMGEDVVSPYLWTRRIQHADVIATTHAHEDHIGGLHALVENFHPAEIWTGAVAAESPESETLAQARAAGIRVLRRRTGEAFEFGGAYFEILSPPSDYEAGKPDNNDSLTMRITYGQHSFLLTGDIERPIEDELVQQHLLSRITVLKVAHHGSKTSSNEEFLDATQPEFAVISAGYLNLFHHPHTEVLERLAAHHVDTLRTDQSGLVTIRSDGRRITVRTNAGEQRLVALPGPLEEW